MRRAAVITGLLLTAAAVTFACVAVSSWKPAPRHVRYAWFCRVYQPGEVMTGPACAYSPGDYKPPWPYLDPSCKVVSRCRVIYPAPSASPARGG